MVSRKLFLHIGLPKCASSSLQIFFAMNSERLSGEGVLYPEIFSLDMCRSQKYGQGNAYSLVYWMLDADQRSMTQCAYPRVSLEDVLDSAPDGSDILLSTEWFTELRRTAVQRISNEAKKRGMEVFIVFVYRDLVSWNLSEYRQALKMGRLKDPLDFTPRNIFSSVKMYEEIFGKEKVVGIPLSREKCIYSEFLSRVGIAGENWQRPSESANKSLSDITLFMQLQAVNLGAPLSQNFLSSFDDNLASFGLNKVKIAKISNASSRFLQAIEKMSKDDLPGAVPYDRAFPEKQSPRVRAEDSGNMREVPWADVQLIAQAFRAFVDKPGYRREGRKDLIYMMNKALIEM